MMQRLSAGMVVLLLVISLVQSAAAQPKEEIVVAGVVVMRIRASAGGLSIAERAKEIRRRINTALLTEDLTAANIFLQRAGGGLSLRVGHVDIVTVTAADARANGTSLSVLAERWLGAMRTALPLAKPTNQP